MHGPCSSPVLIPNTCFAAHGASCERSMAWTTTKRTPTASMPELEKPDKASLVVMTPAFHTTHMAMKAIVSGVLAPFTRKKNITTKTDSTNHGCQVESFMLEGVQLWCSPGGLGLDPITKTCRYNQKMQSACETYSNNASLTSITLSTLVMCFLLSTLADKQSTLIPRPHSADGVTRGLAWYARPSSIYSRTDNPQLSLLSPC